MISVEKKGDQRRNSSRVFVKVGAFDGKLFVATEIILRSDNSDREIDETADLEPES